MKDKNDRRPATLRLCGDYDIARREELAALFQSINGRDPLVIDMSEVSYVDSSFLHELAALRVGDKGRSITLAGVNEHLHKVLKTVSFDRLFVILA